MALIATLRRKLVLSLILAALACGAFGTLEVAAAAGVDTSIEKYSDDCRDTGSRCQCGW